MHIDGFVFSAVLLLIAAAISVALFKRIGLGSVLGLLVAGVIVGPHSPGPYVTAHVEDVRHFAELGVVLLLFVIGLEMKPSRLWSMRRVLFGTGMSQIIVTGAVLSLYLLLGSHSVGVALLLGMTLALSSTAFVMQLLQERGELASRHGGATFSILLMQDIAVVPLLALVPLLSDTATMSPDTPRWQQAATLVAMFGVLWLFGRWLVPRALDWMARSGNREGFWLVVLLSVFLAALLMHQAGLSMALGAFVMGMLLSDSRYNLQVHALVEPYKGLLMSLFFVTVGMSIDIQALSAAPLTFLQHTLVLVAVKLAVLVPLAIAFGYSRADAVRIGALLAQAGEFGFVLFGSALSLGVIEESTFVAGIGVISLSMLMTPVLVRAGYVLATRLEPAASPPQDDVTQLKSLPDKTVLIAGYGRVGHTIATLLESSRIPYIAFDRDPQRVAAARKDNLPVYFADISDPELLTHVDLKDVSLVVISIDDKQKALKSVRLLKELHPHVKIVARAHDLNNCGELITAGADDVYPETIEASLQLGARVLAMTGAPAENVDMLLQGVRDNRYTLLKDTTGVWSEVDDK